MPAEAASVASSRASARRSTLRSVSGGGREVRRGSSPRAEIGRAARSRATRLNLVAGGIVLLIAFFHVWTGLTVGKLGYELSNARQLAARLDQQLNELTVEYSATMKPDLLADEARRRLGLDWPRSGQVVELP